jgi:hypothetical protein
MSLIRNVQGASGLVQNGVRGPERSRRAKAKRCCSPRDRRWAQSNRASKPPTLSGKSSNLMRSAATRSSFPTFYAGCG